MCVSIVTEAGKKTRTTLFVSGAADLLVVVDQSLQALTMAESSGAV